MAIGKPRGRKGMRQVYVYNPAVGRKVYVGSRAKLRGEDGAEALERQMIEEFSRTVDPALDRGAEMTIKAWAAEWLTEHHGQGTKRPAKTSRSVNATGIRPFVAKYGHLPIRGGVARREALGFSRRHPTSNTKSVSAMYTDAVDCEMADANPLANRQQRQSRERKFIKSLTTEEVDRLADIALEEWGPDGYGKVARAWVVFAAWVGCRPGETFNVEVQHLDYEAGTVSIRRIKKRGGVYRTDTVVLPDVVINALNDAPALATSGPMFRTVRGAVFSKGNLRYYWDPIQRAFRKTVTEQRWAELLDGTEDGKHFDFYTLRHRVASHIVAMGGNEFDAAAQLGNSAKVCREYYIHTDQDLANERNRGFLRRGSVVDLAAVRDRKGA